MPYYIEMEVAGDTAMWTRPDTGDSPVSYPAPTYSAVKAMMSAVLWGPAIEIIPIKAEICAPVQFHTYYTNYGGPLRKDKNIKEGSSYQFCATVLVNVCYRLYAEVIPNKRKDKLPSKALEWDRKTTSPGHAYQEIFNKRLARGQCYSTVVLGWREFTTSYFGKFRSETKPVNSLNILIPSMLKQVFSDGYCSEVNYTYENNVEIKNGVLIYGKEVIS